MALTAPPPAAGTSELTSPDGPKPPDKRRRPSGSLILIAVLVLALVVLGGLYWRSQSGPDPLTQQQVNASVQDQLEQAQQQQAALPPAGAQAYRTIAPSLVHISTTSSDSTAAGTTESSGIGAGVVVNADGTVLTALHVVDGADTIRLTFADGSETTAEIDESDESTDSASLIPDELPATLVPAVLGGGAEIGFDVFAIGDPLGLSTSFTGGVVSQLDRTIRIDGGRRLEGLIQFDAAVNPGNSGGPLVNKSGQVVGIVTGLANPSSQPFFVGIGFAVPIAAAGGSGGPPQ